tara:strand:- start:2144 stop:3130 length:987 start_codon:yes stop_codon:yes gene_type:complete
MADARQVEANREELGGFVPMQIMHPGTRAAMGQPVSARDYRSVGRAVEFRVGSQADATERGIPFMARIVWNAEGKELVDAKAFENLSPGIVWGHSFNGRRVGTVYQEISLVPSGWFKGMRQLAASDYSPAHGAEEDTMSEHTKETMAFLGVEKEEDLLSAVTELKTRAERKPEAPTEATGDAVSLADFEAVKTMAFDAQKTANDLQGQMARADAVAFVDDLEARNIILKPQRDGVLKLALVDLDATREAYKDAKPVVEFGGKGNPNRGRGDTSPGAHNGTINDVSTKVMAFMDAAIKDKRAVDEDQALALLSVEHPDLYDAFIGVDIN